MINISERQYYVDLIKNIRKNNKISVKKSCAALGIHHSTYYNWLEEGEVVADGRPTAVRPVPRNALSDEERAKVLEVCNRPEYADLPPEQVVVKYMDDHGAYLCSPRTVYRLLKNNDQLGHRGTTKPPCKSNKPTPLVATGPGQVYCWDWTTAPGPRRDKHWHMLVIMDIFSRKIVAHDVFESENAVNCATVLNKALISEKISTTISIHSDNGSCFRAEFLLDSMELLNVVPSYSRPRVSNDNAYIESYFKTTKYTPRYPWTGFDTIEEAREWMAAFVHWYNNEHLHSGIGYVTPCQRHDNLDGPILAKRNEIMKKAREQHPNRWTANVRQFVRAEKVILNPDNAVAS